MVGRETWLLTRSCFHFLLQLACGNFPSELASFSFHCFLTAHVWCLTLRMYVVMRNPHPLHWWLAPKPCKTLQKHLTDIIIWLINTIFTFKGVNWASSSSWFDSSAGFELVSASSTSPAVEKRNVGGCQGHKNTPCSQVCVALIWDYFHSLKECTTKISPCTSLLFPSALPLAHSSTVAGFVRS